jgi:DNA polymerase-3 subunit gamma/tau
LHLYLIKAEKQFEVFIKGEIMGETMPYLVFARKYRPMTFDDVVGQDHISKILKNSILEKRIAHAYIFSGPRGSGKTTMARIFAKALNCKNGPTTQPCGVCDNCIEISKGISLDVLELDGASNRGIEEIRELRENVKFSPAKSKYKIYIIDEAHQITKDAFNALLKTLEEPPEHVVFIMATTEQHKIPSTILSRCQRYRFRLLSAKEIEGLIKKIGKEENFEIDDEAINIIVEASGGSMRDALSLLEQVISSSSGKISGDYIRDLLGLLPRETIALAAQYLADGDMKAILKIVGQITEEGFDVLQFAKDLRDYLRQIMIYSIDSDILDIAPENKKLFEKQKSLFTPARHVRMNNLISKALEEMRWNDHPRIILEMYLLKMAENYYDVDALLKKIGELEKNIEADNFLPNTSARLSASSQSKTYASPNVSVSAKKENHIQNQDNLQSAEKQSPKKQNYSNQNNSQNGDLFSLWGQIVDEISAKNLTASELTKLALNVVSENEIILSAESQYLKDWGDRYKDEVEKLYRDKTGKNINVKIVIDESKPVAKNENNIEESGEIESEDESAAGTVIEEVDESDLLIDDNEDKTTKEKIPESLKEKAKKWGGTVRKINDK